MENTILPVTDIVIQPSQPKTVISLQAYIYATPTAVFVRILLVCAVIACVVQALVIFRTSVYFERIVGYDQMPKERVEVDTNKDAGHKESEDTDEDVYSDDYSEDEGT